MANCALERRTVKQRGSQNVECVEPTTGLANVLNDVVAWVVGFKPVAVLKRVVNLCEWHRTRFEPAVQNFRHTTHGRFAGWVIRVRASQLVDHRSVEITWTNAKVTFELVKRTVNIYARVVRVVRLPNRNRCTPESVTTDCPVAHVLEPLSERAVLGVVRGPVDLLV